MMFLQLVAEVACARLSISADKRNKRASSQIANGRKKGGNREGESLKAFFQIPQISAYFLKNRFSCQNVKRCGAGGYRVSHARHVCAREAN